MNIDKLLNSGIASADLLEDLYSRYQEDPSSVDASWRTLFDKIETYSDSPKPLPEEPFPVISPKAPDDLRVYHMIEAYRTYGHLMAKVNPISRNEIEEPWQLQLKTLGFTSEELSKPLPTCGLMTEETASLRAIIQTLRSIYCDKIGVEYKGLQNPNMEGWLQSRIEPTRFKVNLSIDQKRMILQYLNRSELFEVFIHTKYTGQKRFSLEGGETLIPILTAIIETGVQLGIDDYVIGMAHRGRLNVLSNIMQKSYSDIFSEFEEGYVAQSFEGSGDVKYHKGFSSKIKTEIGKEVQVDLTPNPSHLEAVNAVVEGQVCAKQVKAGDDIQKSRVLPILIHGDAAIAGQGIIYETLQLYDLKGYSTGGTVHVVINNQIGFTTLPNDSRSTYYCTDIARAFNAPVFHVNAEDPEACVQATILAVELRQRFHCDVFIDLVCYRKYGHNETDEPAFTQPLEYQLIRKKKPIREVYRDDLIQQGVLEKRMAEALEAEFKDALQVALVKAKEPEKRLSKKDILSRRTRAEKVNLFQETKTAVPKKTLKEITERISTVPDSLTIHRKLERLIKDRNAMVMEGKPIDWGMGETLAYATLLWEGNHIRLSGQDCGRGTFSHRHTFWMDQNAERAYYPLKHLKRDQGRFDVYNSPLSEYAVMGFEFGYNLVYQEALVIWEAQFGDFCNGAQVMIDQFIATSEQKWGQKNSLVLLLPHGYEGQGPEHSSARMERFLTLCGDNNLQVVNPTTPAQLFHLLRRQVLREIKKPLIVFTPKALLRLPACVSTLDDFAKGTFEEIIDDPSPPKKPKRLVLCCGKIYYDLIAGREKHKATDMAIVRIEQLYPLDKKGLEKIFAKYKGVKEVIWAQEEPSNMGAWNFIRPKIHDLMKQSFRMKYIGRARSASPAAGSFALHTLQHDEIIEALFGKKRTPSIEVDDN